ncbi:MAG: arsenate reductase (glutaredoxin) [Pseudomonadota bacterium]
MPASLTIYHNPRCSKSRATLKIIQDAGQEPVVIRYLEEPPDRATLVRLLEMLDLRPRDLLRRGESVYKVLRLNDSDLTDEALIDAMLANPVLIERPIVVSGDQAVIGRPPENVTALL